jgi:integrating conjugative element protein (TIGR03765 family)
MGKAQLLIQDGFKMQKNKLIKIIKIFALTILGSAITPISFAVLTDNQTTALIQMMQQNEDKLQNSKIDVNKLLFPVTSSFTVGDVKKHRIKSETNNETKALTFYVAGDDARSINWLKTNAAYLKKIRALGFLTNVQSKDRMLFIEKDTDLTFMAVSLDGLENIVGTSHYPFLLYKGWVMQ